MVQTPHYFYTPDPSRRTSTFSRGTERRRLFLRRGAKLQRLLERDVLLRVVRGHPADSPRRSGRHRRRNRHRRCAHCPEDAAARMEHGVHPVSAGGGPRHRQPCRPHRPENPVGARHGADPAYRLPAIRKRAEMAAGALCYLNSTLHYLYAVPRLIFLTAPLVYLLLNRSNVYGYVLTILAYAFPHIAQSTLTNSRIQGRYRHSFWNEVYETVLALYILLPTTLAMISPKHGKFNVHAQESWVRRVIFCLACGAARHPVAATQPEWHRHGRPAADHRAGTPAGPTDEYVLGLVERHDPRGSSGRRRGTPAAPPRGPPGATLSRASDPGRWARTRRRDRRHVEQRSRPDLGRRRRNTRRRLRHPARHCLRRGGLRFPW